MKNILFIVISFLLLPFASYSQTALSYFQENTKDSTLIVFLKSSNTEHKRDTIYSKEIPKKLIFVFEDIDSTNRRSYAAVNLARGKRAINTFRAKTNQIDYPTQYIIWQTDVFVIEVKDTSKDSTRTLLQSIHILPIPIVEGTQREENERIKDSINRIAAIEYYHKQFEKLKEPQENLTKKDKKRINKLYKNLELGVKLSEDQFIDRIEVSNNSWFYYLEEPTYLRLMPAIDSSICRKLYGDSIFNYKYSLYHNYAYLPVIGITYEQAQSYCIWRSKLDNEFLNNDQKKKYQGYEITVHYRLPTKEEWEYAATKDDLNKQFGGYSTKKRYTEKEKHKIYRYAKNYVDSTRTLEEVKLDIRNYFQSDTSYKYFFNYSTNYNKPYFIQEIGVYEEMKTNWIYSYKPTSQFKLYNMFGNVAEMTSEKGIAKGGSFYHTLEECAADKVQIYDSPQAWLGFRCVAEVVVRKKEGK